MFENFTARDYINGRGCDLGPVIRVCDNDVDVETRFDVDPEQSPVRIAHDVTIRLLIGLSNGRAYIEDHQRRLFDLRKVSVPETAGLIKGRVMHGLDLYCEAARSGVTVLSMSPLQASTRSVVPTHGSSDLKGGQATTGASDHEGGTMDQNFRGWVRQILCWPAMVTC